MGSIKHSKIYDPVTTLKSIRDVFHEVLDELDDQAVFTLSEQRLKADIIERLLHLATHDTPQQDGRRKYAFSG